MKNKFMPVILMTLLPVAAWAAADEDLFFADIPLVSLVSRHDEPVMQAPAAVTVLTQEEIRRSGVTSIPEALRLVPGMEVARVDAHTWAISARGFNDIFASKLLVLVDGRSVYESLFSGVYWDTLNVVLEDIERIEVVRGPGATMWGANAVNGVVNIITKSAKNTQGGLISAGGGSQQQGFGSGRYGGKIGEHTYYRVYGLFKHEGDFRLPDGTDAADEWHMGQMGFRIDSDLNADNLLTVQGDIYSGVEGQRTVVPILTAPYAVVDPTPRRADGGNFLARWTRTFSADSDFRLQTYYSGASKDQVEIEEMAHTFDIDLQHRFPFGQRQQIIWGLGYRLVDSSTTGTFLTFMEPANRTTYFYSAFLQDQITLVENRWHLTLGSKFEHDPYTGFSAQPSGRLLWTPNQQNTVWAAVSRAVRTPGRAEIDGQFNFRVIPAAPPILISVQNDGTMKEEEQLALELGYRVTPRENLSFDVAAFYNFYDDRRSIEAGTPFFDPSPAPGHIVVPASAQNKQDAEIYGVELSATWQPVPWWQWRANYSFLDMQMHEPTSNGRTAEWVETGNPAHQFSLRSGMDLPHHLQFDVWLRYVDVLPFRQDPAVFIVDRVPPYVTLDVRLAWQPNKNFEIAIVGQNLIEPQHAEFGPTLYAAQRTEVPRSVYGKVTWKF